MNHALFDFTPPWKPFEAYMVLTKDGIKTNAEMTNPVITVSPKVTYRFGYLSRLEPLVFENLSKGKTNVVINTETVNKHRTRLAVFKREQIPKIDFFLRIVWFGNAMKGGFVST